MTTASSRIAEVNFVLKTAERKAKSFKTEAESIKYLFNPDSLLLLTDDRKCLEKQPGKLSVKFALATGIESLINKPSAEM